MQRKREEGYNSPASTGTGEPHFCGFLVRVSAFSAMQKAPTRKRRTCTYRALHEPSFTSCIHSWKCNCTHRSQTGSCTARGEEKSRGRQERACLSQSRLAHRHRLEILTPLQEQAMLLLVGRVESGAEGCGSAGEVEKGKKERAVPVAGSTRSGVSGMSAERRA